VDRAEDPPRPCIVHLVRAANGEAPFAGFVDALRSAPPGGDFELVLAMKGFASEQDGRRYAELADGLSPELLFFADEGLDLNVYFAAAARLQRERYCFVNSFSRPLVAGWLQKLDGALAQPGVGLVGASGSWASTFSWMAHMMGLPNAYSGILPPRRAAIEQFLALEAELVEDPEVTPPPTLIERLGKKLRTLRRLPGDTLPFERFPAHHIRTNAFMLSQATLAALRLHEIRQKRDAYRLEHGRNSITHQVQRLGLRALVVDRDGATYDCEQWDRSRTFWQGDQEGLLVADNQTRRYAEGDASRRRLLSSFAWGASADPLLPTPVPSGATR
jgi:hypothetical protein